MALGITVSGKTSQIAQREAARWSYCISPAFVIAVHDKENDWQGAQNRSRQTSTTSKNLPIAKFSRHSWLFEKNQSLFQINMEPTCLHSRGSGALERMQNVLKKMRLGKAILQQNWKIILYLLPALFALVYVVRVSRTRKANGKPRLKLRSRSPDPEKTDPRKSGTKQTKAIRPFGSKLTIRVMPVYNS